MKVAVLVAPRTIQILERPMPEPGPGQVRLKLAAVGVCGSDVHYYEHGRIGSQVVEYPILLGHEPSGVVDAVGEGVALASGTRVAVEPGQSCGKCEHCLAGRQNICPNVEFLGTPPYDGIFAQYALMPERCCVPIPDAMSFVEAALLEPLGIGLHAAALARIACGESVAIFGAGPIGLVTLLAVRAAGAGKVYMTDLVPERVAFAQRLGADAAMKADEGDVIEWIMGLTNGRGVDVAFEAAGEPETTWQTIETARIGGRALIIGIPQVDELPYPTHGARRKELTIQHCRRANGEAFAALDLIASGRIDVKPLATHTFPLDRTAEAIDLVSGYRDGVIRAMILPNGEMD